MGRNRAWLKLLLAACALSQVAAGQETAEAPAVADLVDAIDARWHSVERLRALISKIAYVTATKQGMPWFVPMGGVTASIDYSVDRVIGQSISCLPRRDATQPVRDLTLLFTYEDFERRYEARLQEVDLPSLEKVRVRNTVMEPDHGEAWIVMSLGLAADYEPWSTRIPTGEAEVSVETVMGHRCARITSEAESHWFGLDLGMAPVRRTRESTLPDGTLQRSEAVWLDFEPVEAGYPLFLPRHYLARTQVQNVAERQDWPDWHTQWLAITAIADVMVNPAAHDLVDRWPLVLPMFVGGVFSNQVTGLPDRRITIGHSIRALREQMYETDSPFGVEVPEVREQRVRELDLAAEAEAE